MSIALASQYTQRNYRWTDWKAIKTAKSLVYQYDDDGTIYTIYGYDGPEVHVCQIFKDTVPYSIIDSGYSQSQNDSDKSDFETNYLSNSNRMLGVPIDSDGSPLQRVKITTTGWHYQLQGIEFETSKLNSEYSKKVDGTDFGFTTMKFYKLVEGAEIEITGDDLNQTYLDSNCIKTVIDWEPTHDLEIIGGMLKMASVPSENLRMWTVGVPDIPEAYGGSKAFVVNVNLKFIGLEDGVKVDGRAPKYLTYSATYHTSKLRMIFRHSAGFKHNLHMIFELFKA